MKALIFPGQGAQFPGMGKEIYDENSEARKWFEKANAILGFNITDIMFGEDEEALKQTKITQPSIFLHSVIRFYCLEVAVIPDMVAGHSLGEFSALVANQCISFEDGLKLVHERALAMQEACEANPSTMAAVLGLDDQKVEEVCARAKDTVVPANFNCPGQVVISGLQSAIEEVSPWLAEAGVKRVIPLKVGGAFHSPLMESARVRLENKIMETTFNKPICPVFQNFNAAPSSDPDIIKENLIRQLTGAVRWTQSVQNMIDYGATTFIEIGPDKVLQGLVRKISREVETLGHQ